MTYLYVVSIDAEKSWGLSFFLKRLWMVITMIHKYLSLLFIVNGSGCNLSFLKEFFLIHSLLALYILAPFFMTYLYVVEFQLIITHFSWFYNNNLYPITKKQIKLLCGIEIHSLYCKNVKTKCHSIRTLSHSHSKFFFFWMHELMSFLKKILSISETNIY